MIEINANDSCKETNRSMRMIFDILTPRPHFIITQRDEYRKSNVTDQQVDDLFELIHQFLIDKCQYDINAILSFHRGVWYQQKHQHFHAHLCVSKKPYCQEVKTAVNRCFFFVIVSFDDYKLRRSIMMVVYHQLII